MTKPWRWAPRGLCNSFYTYFLCGFYPLKCVHKQMLFWKVVLVTVRSFLEIQAFLLFYFACPRTQLTERFGVNLQSRRNNTYTLCRVEGNCPSCLRFFGTKLRLIPLLISTYRTGNFNLPLIHIWHTCSKHHSSLSLICVCCPE